jgi:hypothetical protein
MVRTTPLSSPHPNRTRVDDGVPPLVWGLEAGCAIETTLQWVTLSDPSSWQQEQEADSYIPESHHHLTKKNGTLEHALPGGLPLLHLCPRMFVTGHG